MSKLNNLVSRIMNIDAIQRQSIISFIWQIVLAAFGFLSTVYFARTVGASVLGGYFLFVSYFSIVSMVTDGGFAVAAIKRISEGEEQNEYFSAFVALRLLFVILIVLILIAFRGYFVDLNNAGTFIWLLLALFVAVLYGAISYGLQGSGKVGIHATGNFINNFSRVVIQVVAIYLGFSVAGLAGGFVAGMFIAAIIQLRFLNLRLTRFGWKHIKSLSTFSLWIFFISSGMVVFSTADTIMIGYYLGNADVGVYRIVLQFTSLASFTMVAFRSTLLPRISRWGKIGKMDPIQISLSRALTYSLILAIPMLVGGFILGDKLLYHFYGKDFAQGYSTLVILFFVQIVNIFYYLFSTYLTAMDQLKDLCKATLIAVVMNIGLNVLLIPSMGINGAAVAALCTMGLNVIMTFSILSKNVKIVLETDSLINILKASFIMLVFIGCYRLFIPISSLLLVLIPTILGVIIYTVLILKYDRKINEELMSIIRQIVYQ
jgi:O-antigen/teichoic acid export membrane protein